MQHKIKHDLIATAVLLAATLVLAMGWHLLIDDGKKSPSFPPEQAITDN